MAEEKEEEKKIAVPLPQGEKAEALDAAAGEEKELLAPEEEEESPTEDEEKHTIASRGIPSKDSLYLPPHNSPELRSFQDGNENITRNTWNLTEVVNFIFPARYQLKYNEIALAFLKTCT